MRLIAIALLSLSTAACAQFDQPDRVNFSSTPIYQRPQDAQLPIGEQTTALKSAEMGCANQESTGVLAEQNQMPMIPGGPDAIIHRQQAMQGSPAASAVGDADFDVCMHSLGYDRAE